jgi:hypothetical protein
LRTLDRDVLAVPLVVALHRPAGATDARQRFGAACDKRCTVRLCIAWSKCSDHGNAQNWDCGARM